MAKAIQANFRIILEGKDLLKLPCYLMDSNESAVIQAALTALRLLKIRRISQMGTKTQVEKFLLMLKRLDKQYKPETRQVGFQLHENDWRTI